MRICDAVYVGPDWHAAVSRSQIVTEDFLVEMDEEVISLDLALRLALEALGIVLTRAWAVDDGTRLADSEVRQ